MKGPLLVVAACVVAIIALGRIPAASAGVDSVDLVIQQAFAADAEGFCVAPIPWCYGVCEPNCNTFSHCNDDACAGPDPDCVSIFPWPLCCSTIPYEHCDCV